MAGHSKWANIKHRKAAQDAKRGKIFTRLIKEITIATREGGGDPNVNARLRQLIEKAKEVNMPLSNIQRAVKRGTGELPGVHYEEIVYEGYGPFGVAVIVEALTDNKNRTVSEIRRLFSHSSGNLSESGSVAWMFSRAGVIRLTTTATEDTLLEQLLDADILNISKDDNLATITCEPQNLDATVKILQDIGHTVEDAQIEFVASNTTQLDDEQSQKVYDFLSLLSDHDDVQSVYTNLVS